MLRTFVRFLSVCILQCGSLGSVIALDFHRVASGVYYFQGVMARASQDNRGFTSNAGFVVTRDGVIVFDALGTPQLGKEMLAAIASVTRKPVRRVIVSHYHADHVYGLQAFQDVGAEIWAHRDGQLYLRSDHALTRLAERRRSLAPWVDDRTRLVGADRWIDFADRDEIAFELGGQRFRLIRAGPAHAPDDLMMFVERSRVLFAGDVFFSGRLPFVVDGNTRGWLDAIERIKHLDAKIVIPGHGPASYQVNRDLWTTERYLRVLRAEMGAAVAALETFDEAFARRDWSEFAALPTFADAHRRNAYSVYLEMQSELLETPIESKQ